MAPSPRKKSNPTKIVKEIPESSERSRRASTKLVTAATNSAVLQKSLDPRTSLSPVPPPPRNTRATPESSKTKCKDHEKKKLSNERSVTKTNVKNARDTGKTKEEGKQIKNLISPKKRKRDDKNDNNKKSKVSDTEDSVRRSRRETTRNSTLATLNSS